MSSLGLKIFTIGFIVGLIVSIYGLFLAYWQFDAYIIRGSSSEEEFRSMLTHNLLLGTANVIASLIAVVGLLVMLLVNSKQTKVETQLAFKQIRNCRE